LKYLEAEKNFYQAVEQEKDMETIEALQMEVDRLEALKPKSSNLILSAEQVMSKIELFIETHNIPRAKALIANRDMNGLRAFKELIAELKKVLEELSLKSDSFVGDNMIEKIDDDAEAPVQTKPLSELSVDDVIHLLESLNLSNFCYNFEDNRIDGPTLMNCKSEDDVKELGIALTAKARILYEEIVKFKSTGVPLTLLSEEHHPEVPAVINCDEVTIVFSEITYDHSV